ncbi:MFS transporter [Streptomyces sp. NPDC001787]|uniref:MFS transporter n=1 Tax=Streptomyces sp. NPDC001787 TaxID=3154523 RepID=UPI00332A26FE
MAETRDVAPGEASAQGHPRRWLILAAVGAAQFIVLLDSTIVNVALPSIQRDLDASTSSLQWVMNAYILLFGSLLLLGGRAADILGRRRAFVVGLVVFTLASAACGLASSSEILVGARALQGIGAAPLSAAALSIVVSVFREPKEQGIALTVWSGLGVIGGTVGVVLGGAMVDWADWRWAFWLNVPIGIATLVAAMKLVPALRPGDGTARPRFDLPGAVLAVAGLLMLTYGLIGAAEHGWTSVQTLGPIAGSLIVLALFAVVQLRTRDALMPLRLLAIGRFTVSGLGLLLASGLMITVFYMVSVYEQEVLGYSPLEAGLGMLGMGIGSTLMAFGIPAVLKKLGLERTYLLGSVLLLAGSLLLVDLPTSGSYFTVLLPGTTVIGLGLPACFVSLTTMGVMQVEESESGLASGFLNTLLQVGAALGMATVVTLAAAHTTTQVGEGHGLREAMAAGYSWGFVALAGVAGVSVLVALGFVLGTRKPARARPATGKGASVPVGSDADA